jgi:hypothetical protein
VIEQRRRPCRLRSTRSPFPIVVGLTAPSATGQSIGNESGARADVPIEGIPEPLDPSSDWVCVTLRRVGADDIVMRKVSRADYDNAIVGNTIAGRDLGGINWLEHEVFRLDPSE